MTDLSALSTAHLVLLAVQQCLGGDVTALPYIRAQDTRGVLTPELCYRIILTFLPETVEPRRYTSVVERLAKSTEQPSGEDDVDFDIDITAVKELSVANAAKEANALHLLPLKHPNGLPFNNDETNNSALLDFLVHRSRRIDTETGLQPYILDLLGPFLDTSTQLRNWAVSRILPLLRFNYEYFPKEAAAGSLSLEVAESMDVATAINLFMSRTRSKSSGGDAGRDLRGLAGPWVYGVCCQSKGRQEEVMKAWDEIYEWLVSTARRDFDVAADAVDGWDGPSDIDLGGYVEGNGMLDDSLMPALNERYAQAAMACIYANTSSLVPNAPIILSRIRRSILPTDAPQRSSSVDSFDSLHLPTISRSDLLQNELLSPTNALTRPDPNTLAFVDALLLSYVKLLALGRELSCRAAADICLLGDESSQLQAFQSILEELRQAPRKDRDWEETRDALLWLRNWSTATADRGDGNDVATVGLFWRVGQVTADKLILETMLVVGQHDLAVDIYAKQPRRSSLPPSEVESTVTSALLFCYDKATNGNKTRGRIKQASEILNAFAPYFPSSVAFQHIQNLISATHSLSFYSLTLQHGVPFQPVSIRIHPDPLSLLEKILQQNDKAYTRVEDLLDIARQLILAGFKASAPADGQSLQGQDYDSILTTSRPTSEEQKELATAEKRVLSMCIRSALAANDFDTAYSFIFTRIAPPPSTFVKGTPEMLAFKDDDLSWRTVCNAGSHRSPTSANMPLHKQIMHLSQKMELLSLALFLVPSPENLTEVLAAWRRCEEEMNVLRAKELEEEEEWATRADRVRFSGEYERPKKPALGISTTFLSSGKQAHNVVEGEEAPMGLFDVARGAARALRKNAFPLRGVGAGAGASHTKQSSAVSPSAMSPAEASLRGSEDSVRTGTPVSGAPSKRPRKRDMVSSMVTGGLASGIGWVLGAQPVHVPDEPAEPDLEPEVEPVHESDWAKSAGVGHVGHVSPIQQHSGDPGFTEDAGAADDWEENWDWDNDNQQ